MRDGVFENRSGQLFGVRKEWGAGNVGKEKEMVKGGTEGKAWQGSWL